MYCRTLQGGVAYMDGGTATFTSCTFSGNSAVRTRIFCSIPQLIGSLAYVASIGWCMRRGARQAGAAALWRAGTLVRAERALPLRAVRVERAAPPRVRPIARRKQGVMRGSAWFGVCSPYERLLPLVRDDAALERARRRERRGLSRGCGGALRMRHRDG